MTSPAELRASQTRAPADRPRARRSGASEGSSATVRVPITRSSVTRSEDGTGAKFAGYASITERSYEMWDFFGTYSEKVSAGAFARTLAADPQVELVVNHSFGGQLPLAHTRNDTLRLSEDTEGLRVEADLDSARHDVHDVLAALERGDVAEMSFRFMINRGEWSPDYTEYRIDEVDMDRGDVSIVNFGANPHTYIETPARRSADAGQQVARDESSAAEALGDDQPAEPTPTTPEEVTPVTATPVELAAQVVEPTIPAPNSDEEALRSRVALLEEQLRTRTAAEDAQRTPTAPTRAYDQVARVGREERTYRPDMDRRGGKFVRDAVMAHLGDFSAVERVSRHMAEERVERADWFARAAGTTAFAGLVVPQYLTDLYAPAAKAGRPLANAIRHLDLPADGMTVNLSRITTATTTAVQTQGNAVSETDIDDTLLSPAVQTIAGSQTVTRQAVERGTGTLDVVIEDLSRSYGTSLDSTLLNQATTGLTNVATSIAYTDASPTAPELYPKLLAGVAAVEAALVDQSQGDVIAVMHSRRWYWIQSQLSSTFPLIGQAFPVNVAGVVDPMSTYGSGFRGVLPSGTPVIVDNNIATNLGAGTNEDEIYFVSRNESFLWEDPSAPMLIRTETGPSVKSLGVDVVVYGYIAYTFARQVHGQKIGGTGLVTPTF